MLALLVCLVLSFSVPVAWGQEQSPAAVLLEYHTVLKGSFSFEPLVPYYTPERWRTLRRRFPPSMRAAAFSLRKSSAPDAVEIVGEQRQGDTTTLQLAGSTGSKRYEGEAELWLWNGEWRIHHLQWHQH